EVSAGQELPYVAVKAYRPPESEQAAALITREAIVHFRLRLHPNIVTPLDEGVETVEIPGFYGGDTRIVDHPYLVTEFADGRSLYQRMQAGPLSLAAIRRVAVESGSAAHFAHRAGIIVRDLKPSNILGVREPKTGEERNRLADFGIDKL